MEDEETSTTLPSLRELQLEELLRKRERQLLKLVDEIKSLKEHAKDVATSDPPSSEQAVSTAAMAVLAPHLVNERNAALGTGSFNGMAHTGLVAALRQRTKLLEEENEELYSVLRRSETGRLEEEVKALRNLVGKLGRSLQESHEKAKYLSDEVERTTEVINRRPNVYAPERDSTPPNAVRNNRHASPQASWSSQASSKLAVQPPSAPRAHKKARTQMSPAPVSVKKEQQAGDRHRSTSRPQRNEKLEERSGPTSGRDSGMELDTRPNRERERPRPERERSFEREQRERERDRDRDRDRQRERDQTNQRSPTNSSSNTPTNPSNGSGMQIRGVARNRGADPGYGRNSPRRGGNGGFGGRQNGLPNRPDKGLAERMGL